jgi:hypothetical protein
MPYVKQNNEPNKELIEKYKTFHIAHQYDRVAKIWKFIGYTCSQCHRTVQNPNIVPKHFQNCVYKGPTVYLQDPDPSQIRTISGRPYAPLEINHKFSTINTKETEL